MSDYVLVHYGIKGMKWGVRKNPEVASARKVYRQAKQDYNRAYGTAYNRGMDAYSLSKKRRQANTKRWEDVYNKGKALDSAEKDYKVAKATAKTQAKAERAVAKMEKQQRKEAAKAQSKENLKDEVVAKTDKSNKTGAKVAKNVLGTIGKMYIADVMLFGGEGTKAVKRGAEYAKKATLDKMFNASILDASGKVIYRYNM